MCTQPLVHPKPGTPICIQERPWHLTSDTQRSSCSHHGMLAPPSQYCAATLVVLHGMCQSSSACMQVTYIAAMQTRPHCQQQYSSNAASQQVRKARSQSEHTPRATQNSKE
jgi:hypothetical protein